MKAAQSRLTLCDPVDYTVHGILQARILSPGDLPNPGIKPRSPTLKVDSLPVELQGKSFTGQNSANISYKLKKNNDRISRHSRNLSSSFSYYQVLLERVLGRNLVPVQSPPQALAQKP